AAAQVHPGPRRRIHRLRDLRIDFSLKYTARHTSRLKKLAGLWPSPGGEALETMSSGFHLLPFLPH
ncbi:MAG: hypothetical protein ABIJ39_08275, partial [Chloroflexota bacterium]